MSDPFIGEIRMFGGNFPPRNWAICDGSILQINQYQALFSLLGSVYGGNGITTFALPDLRGRVPMHWGTGGGLTPRTIGEIGGTETVTLSVTEMPAHNHNVQAYSGRANYSLPTGALMATTSSDAYSDETDSTDSLVTMNPQSLSTVGGGAPHQNMQPYLCISFIISLSGLYPSRN